MSASVILAGVALIAGAGCGGEQGRDPSPAPSAEARIGEVERVLRDRVALLSEGTTITGVTTMVRVGDETRIVTVGLADAAAKEPMRPGDTFPIASLTKPMVATAILQEVESRKLTLDDTLEKWLPDTVANGDRITIRQLLSHRSGVHEPQSLDELPPLDKLTDRDIVKILGAKQADFEPGTSSGYSNFGYILLGMILEKVTGASVGEVLDSRIFDPAGMDDSVLAPKLWDVHGYDTGKDVTADTGLNVAQAAGSVVSTAEDVDDFFQNLWAGNLLSPDLVELMSRPLGDLRPHGGEYGLGVWTTTLSCGAAMGHHGDAPGYAVKAWTLRGSARSVVVLVNEGGPDGHAIADAIAETALCS
jgi:D-alanyl-D-alanine carboxypeptidase